jgi:hypothetical protein
VITIDRSKGLILLTIMVVATILGGIALTTVGADTRKEKTSAAFVANTDTENTVESTPLVDDTEGGSTVEVLTLTDTNESANDSAGFMPWGMMFGTRAQGRFRGLGGHRGARGFGFIEVSEEFKENVINITESDTDVQALLDDGYNITIVRPIIKTVVDGDGNIVTKATDAIVILSNDETGKASVWVNLEEARVTEIMIITRTIIEKP